MYISLRLTLLLLQDIRVLIVAVDDEVDLREDNKRLVSMKNRRSHTSVLVSESPPDGINNGSCFSGRYDMTTDAHKKTITCVMQRKVTYGPREGPQLSLHLTREGETRSSSGVSVVGTRILD